MSEAEEEMRPTHDEIAERAYALWQHRGCPLGSPEEDWFRAEQALAEQGEPMTEAQATAS